MKPDVTIKLEGNKTDVNVTVLNPGTASFLGKEKMVNFRTTESAKTAKHSGHLGPRA